MSKSQYPKSSQKNSFLNLQSKKAEPSETLSNLLISSNPTLKTIRNLPHWDRRSSSLTNQQESSMSPGSKTRWIQNQNQKKTIKVMMKSKVRKAARWQREKVCKWIRTIKISYWLRKINNQTHSIIKYQWDKPYHRTPIPRKKPYNLIKELCWMTAPISSKSSVSMNSWRNVSNNQAFFSKSDRQKRVNYFLKPTANCQHNKMDKSKRPMNLTVKTVNSLPVPKSYISEAKLFWITWKSVTTWRESSSTILTNHSKVKTSQM